MSYMRSWIPAQELYLQKYGHYADADEQLAKGSLGVLVVPTDIPYDFSIDSGSSATSHWRGRATPTQSGLRYFYIDEQGSLLSSPHRPPKCVILAASFGIDRQFVDAGCKDRIVPHCAGLTSQWEFGHRPVGEHGNADKTARAEEVRDPGAGVGRGPPNTT